MELFVRHQAEQGVLFDQFPQLGDIDLIFVVFDYFGLGHAAVAFSFPNAMFCNRFLSFRRLSRRTNMVKTGGTKNNANKVAPIIPPATAMASGGQKIPPQMISGRNPPIVVSVVEMICRLPTTTTSRIAS